MDDTEKERYLESIQENGAILAETARLGLDPLVPSCPGWTVGHLIVHTGGVHHGWARHIESGSLESPGFAPGMFEAVPGLLDWAMKAFETEEDPGPVPPGAIEWFEDGTGQLLAVLTATDPEQPSFHWSGDHRVLSTLRMQRVETALHRWDGQLAHGRVQPIDEETARTGIDHYFEVMLPAHRSWHEAPEGKGESFHFHRTDGEGEWYVRFDGPDAEVLAEHRKAGVAARGTAEQLFLYLWGRLPPEDLDTVGDLALLNRWQEFVPPAE